jgi:hypothetical protein
MRSIWQYRLVELNAPGPNELEAQLNHLGQDGWELAAALEDRNTLVLKRTAIATSNNGKAMVENPEEPDVVTGV